MSSKISIIAGDLSDNKVKCNRCKRMSDDYNIVKYDIRMLGDQLKFNLCAWCFDEFTKWLIGKCATEDGSLSKEMVVGK